MSYEKQTWANGDIITAEKMNHMEDGIESASSGGGGGSNIIIAYITPTSMTHGTCPYTPEEIRTYINNGNIVLFSLNGWISSSPVAVASSTDGVWLEGSGLGINPMNNNSLDLWNVEYSHSLITGNTVLTFELIPYATPQS